MALVRSTFTWAALLAPLIFSGVVQAEKFLIVTGDSSIALVFAPPIIDSYKSMGIQAELINIPNGRLWQLSNKGHFDADLVRASKVGAQAKYLLKVPVPLGKVEMKLYCGPNVEVCDLSVLDDPNSIVATIEGLNSFQRILDNKPITQYSVSNAKQVHDLVLKGRIPYTLAVVHESNTSFPSIDGLQAAKGVIIEDIVYHYIHHKHKALLPKLTATLKLTVQASNLVISNPN